MIIITPQFIAQDNGKERVAFIQEERDDLLLDGIHKLTCDCGYYRLIHRLPFRCHDCAAYWFTPEQIAVSQATLQPIR